MSENQGEDLCPHYRPSATPGRNRPVCCYYIAEGEGAGGCSRPDHFMCEYWLQARETKPTKQKGE